MKKFLALLITLLLVLSMAPFALAEEETDRHLIGDGANTLKVAFDGEAFPLEVLAEVAQRFYDETGISVELMFIPSTGGWSGFFNKLQTMIAGGDTPDVIRIAIEGFEVFRTNGLAEPLNQYIEKYPEYWAMVADNHEQLIAPLTVDGETYAIGFEWNNVVMHFNTDLLAEVGLEMPGADWTYEDFLEYAKALTFTREDGTKVWGYNLVDSYFEISAWLFNNGAAILNDDMTECVINSPEAIETIQFLKDLIYVHEVAPLNNGDFIGGQVGMHNAGRWSFKSYNESDFKSVDLQFLPGNGKERTVISGFGMWLVSSATEKKDDAFKLSCFLSSQDSQRTIIDITGIPMSKQVMKEVCVDTDWPANSRIFYDTADYARGVQSPSTYNDIQVAFDRYMSLIFADEMPVEEALNACKEEIDLILMMG